MLPFYKMLLPTKKIDAAFLILSLFVLSSFVYAADKSAADKML
jgi:hypothetical protein